MIHFFFLGAQIGFVFGAGLDFNRHALDNFNAIARQADYLLGLLVRRRTFLMPRS